MTLSTHVLVSKLAIYVYNIVLFQCMQRKHLNVIFKCFFMYITQKFNEKLILKTTNNPQRRSMKALKVISEVMKFLKNKLLKMFEAAKYDAKDTDIRWVITVPAIWKASARQLMRIAAYDVST